MHTGVTPAEAVQLILERIAPLEVEPVPVPGALDRVLAVEVRSPIDVPPWDNAAMDGYAVRSADLTAAGAAGGAEQGGRGRPSAGDVVLRLVEEIPAGAFPRKALGPGECARIFTGAPIPEGADTVIRQEDTTSLGHDRVRLDDLRDAGRNVRRRGEDIGQGDVVLTPGTELGPAQLGALASLAINKVQVHRRPRVALLTAGDELAPLEEREAILSGRKIASSNTYTMGAMITKAGGDPLDLGIARDDPADLQERLSRAASADLLVTSGGMSVGEHDYLRALLQELGGELQFWRVKMRPGAPVGFGLLRGLPWIGLPGNPVSTMVTFEVFVRPAIRKLQGHTKLFRRTVSVRVGQRLELSPGLEHFLRVQLSRDGEELVAHLTGPQGSGILSSMLKADALLLVPEGRTVVHTGEALRAILLHESVHVEEVPLYPTSAEAGS